MIDDQKELADLFTKSFCTILSDDPNHCHTNNSSVIERSSKVELKSFNEVRECRSSTIMLLADQPPFVSSFEPLFSPDNQLESIETRATDTDSPF